MQEIRIGQLEDPRVEIYTCLNDKQVKRYNEPESGYFICESEKVIRRALRAGYLADSFFVEEGRQVIVADLLAQSRLFPEQTGKESEIPVYVSDKTLMRQITGYALTGGILCVMRRKPQKNEEEILNTYKNLVLLDDIENPTNVGAIFRSAAALGAEALLLTAGCADPLYRRAARVSMGSVFVVDWTFVSEGIVQSLKEHDFCVSALALSDQAKDLGDPGVYKKSKNALVLGNEAHGVSPDLQKACDQVLKIPMKKGVDSLNVAAASAVAFWEFFS